MLKGFDDMLQIMKLRRELNFVLREIGLQSRWVPNGILEDARLKVLESSLVADTRCVRLDALRRCCGIKVIILMRGM